MLAYFSGNKRYAKYFERETRYLTALNLMEVYYVVLRQFGAEDADKAYSAASKYMVEFTDDDIKAAMKKRLELSKKKIDLSYADALGYVIALKLRVKFLTGDNAFRNLENVEFVK